MKKKFISILLAVAALAALAIPASAAEASNKTTVEFTYNTDKEIDVDNEDSLYTITIPASVVMEGTEGTKGATFNGTGTITLDGMIGQEDHVDIWVASTNGYILTSETGATNVKYQMTTTSNSDGITAQTGTFNNANCGTGTYSVSKNTAIAFQNNGTITMTFSNDGDTGVYGKCDLKDTLTFTYAYNDTMADEEGLSNTFFTQAQ